MQAQHLFVTQAGVEGSIYVDFEALKDNSRGGGVYLQHFCINRESDMVNAFSYRE